VSDEDATEPSLQKARGDGHAIGEPGEALAEPGPGKARGIAEIHRPAQGAPEARSKVKAHLPVVDVEKERASSEDALEIAHARASQLGLRRHDQITVGPARHVGHDAKEAGQAAALHRRVAHGTSGHRLPYPGSGAGPDHLDGAEGLEEPGEEVGAPRRVVAQIEAEHRDLHRRAARSR
jgi:hypothetical protein